MSPGGKQTWNIVVPDSHDHNNGGISCIPDIGDRVFGVTGARVWNELPSSVVSAPSLAVLKRNLKTHSSHWRHAFYCFYFPLLFCLCRSVETFWLTSR